MIPDSVKHIYYRGFLKSCNYSCSYCPFAKRPVNQTELKKDKEALNRFVSWVEEQKNSLSIMFVPYGEALIHPYYIKAFAQLSKMPNVIAISCQTNLSLNPEKFIENLKKEAPDLNKINLWATFHHEMESKERFAEKVQYLSRHIDMCVGVVGTPQMVSALSEFKSLLPAPVYLWVNAMEGLNRKYTAEELDIIESVDPQFPLELANPKADINKCNAGEESLFVTAEGEVYACNRSKVKLGNIYVPEGLNEPSCKTRACDCFLAYAHRTDMESLNLFGGGKYIRIPKNTSINTLFFDIDGTLTNDSGVIEESTIEAIERLSKKHRIYLATALPFVYAMRKCKAIRPYLSGGVFANGADMRDLNAKYQHIVPMGPVKVGQVEDVKTLVFSCKNALYKTAYTGNIRLITKLYEQLTKEQGSKYHILFEDGIVSLTDKKATKLSGLLHLCNYLKLDHKNVMVVGNGENDIEMLSHFSHSVAVQAASDKVKSQAAYTMSIEHLSIFI